jgi:hypothetical protein
MAESTVVLYQMDQDKKQATCLIIMAIEGSWFGYATVMGLVYKDTHHTKS